MHGRRTAHRAAAVVLLALLVCRAAHAQYADHIDAQCWPSGIISQEDYPFCRLLDDNYALHWNINDQAVNFAIFISGVYNFIGLGITDGGLTGADLWMARSDDAQPWLANPWHAEDFFSLNATAGPVLDVSQDVTLTFVEQTQTYTFVGLQRSLDTCDRLQDFKIYNDTDQNVIFAYAPSYSQDLWQQATTVQVRLNPTNFSTANLTNTTASYYLELYTQDPADLAAMPLTASKFKVPANTTAVYRCIDLSIGDRLTSADYQSDVLAQKYHVIRYGGIADTPAFHHAVLYACTQPHVNGSRSYTCSGKPQPSCAAYYALWTPSSGNYSLPLEAGLPMGLGSYVYFSLVIHYTNPTSLPVVDSSGIVLYYTHNALRANDAAVLKLGAFTSLNGTAEGSQVVARSTCPSACTAAMLASTSTPIKMFSSFIRMPGLGSAAQTRHVRNNTEIQPLAVRSYWNASYQYTMTALPQSRLLLPGDSIVTECNLTYSSSDLRIMNKDYCMNLVMYFPATSWTDCSTYDGLSSGQPAIQACGPAAMYANLSTAADLAVLRQANMLFNASSTWTLPSYVEPCTQYIPDEVVPWTGHAVGAIVGVSLALILLSWYLLAKYGHEENPERMQLMEEMQMRLRSNSLMSDDAPQFIMAGATRG